MPNEPQDDSTPPTTSSNQDKTIEPYSVYTLREKWFIVALIAFGGLFSPLSSNIYFPAIPILSQAFHKSVELINLTVTMYIVFQALAPMFWGTLADSWGRRPMFICCLILLAVSCVGLALVPLNAYWLLLVLRCFQAAGSASTIALGAGVIGDISDRAERGGFLGVYSIGPMVGPAIGPVIGGALADSLGWRRVECNQSIFWFLCIASAACAVVLILFLPETLRAIVGNGSITPPSILSRPIVPIVGRNRSAPSIVKIPRKPFQNPVRLLLNPDILILLGFNGLVCAVFYGVTASISTILHDSYPGLNETQLGLCFLAIGGGMLFGSATSGKILDWDYQRVKKILAQREIEKSSSSPDDVPPDFVSPGQDDSFPIEQARMRLIPILLAFFVAVCAAYGWCVQRRVNLSGPLILLIGVGFFTMTVMNATQTLILDLVPDQSSSVTACNNLLRGGLSAIMVAVIQLILDALKPGWTYVLLAGMCVVVSPLIYVVLKIGPVCRSKRRRIREAKKEKEGGN